MLDYPRNRSWARILWQTCVQKTRHSS